jgi:hypothetical protein
MCRTEKQIRPEAAQAAAQACFSLFRLVSLQLKHRNLLFLYSSETTETNVLCFGQCRNFFRLQFRLFRNKTSTVSRNTIGTQNKDEKLKNIRLNFLCEN